MEGLDILRLLPPTPASSSIHLLASITCERDLELWQFDAEQAFVPSELEEDAFMSLPEGCGSLPGKVLIVRFNHSHLIYRV